MSRKSPRKKKPAAKVHRVTKRHHVEVELTHYARALDKLYTKIDMAKMIPQVVQKMRTEYHTNPHDFYLMVCEKYGQTPEKKFDTDLLVYGRTKHKKWKLEQDADKERVGEKKERELQTKVGDAVEATDKTESKVVEANETKVDDVTETVDTNVEVEKTTQVAQIEEKKEDLPTQFKYTEAEQVQAVEAKPPAREIVTQTPRRAQIVDRMYMPQASQQRYSPRNEAVRRERASPRTSQRGASQPSANQVVAMPSIEYVNLYVGDICETMVLTGSGPNQETGFWVPARVLSINTETEEMDLEVLQPVKYGLARKANNVPYRYVRAPSQIIWQQ